MFTVHFVYDQSPQLQRRLESLPWIGMTLEWVMCSTVKYKCLNHLDYAATYVIILRIHANREPAPFPPCSLIRKLLPLQPLRYFMDLSRLAYTMTNTSLPDR